MGEWRFLSRHRASQWRGIARRTAIGFGAALLAAFLFSERDDGAAREPNVLLSIPAAEARFVPPASLPDAAPQLVALASLRVPDRETVQPPWRRFAAPARVHAGQPAIAIVLDDLGGSARDVERVLELKAALTLSFLPAGADAPALAARARRAGHDVLLHIPMEPNDSRLDPGESALLVDRDATALRRTLADSLERFDGYVGINNHMGSRFTRDRRGMAVVLTELKARGLMFLDSKTTLGSQAPWVAGALRLPFAERDVFLDAVIEPEAIAFQLRRLERVARERGVAVAIGHPHDATLAALRAWLPEARARGFAIVPVSYAAAQRCGC